jgi:DNA-binding SARP family transcriptional activator
MNSAAVTEIRAFGPLTVAGRTVPRRRERTLLALLVAAHGQPVTGSRLAGQLWHGEPPPSVQTALQVAASRLRSLVEPDRPPRGPARHVVSVGDGYALRLPADAVDLWRFAAAARRATSAPAGERVARCDEALGWWTGAPYADCAETSLVRGEVDRLTETRLSLLETRAGALLDLGRPDLVVRELAPVAREHPFREGLWSLLALGQYRTLRQADALATLRELRRRLAGELGIDPSAQVRELETGILRQAPELAGPPAAVSIGVAVEAGVPAAAGEAAASGLVGRDAALAVLTGAVDRLLAGHGGAAIVSGEAGIGKSELAAAARRYAAAHGAAVAVGRCHEADLAPAFWPWLPVLRQLTGQLTDQSAAQLTGQPAGQLAADDVPKEIGPLLDEGRDAPEPGGAAVLRTYDAMARLVAGAGHRQPLLLVIEDVHWADASSLRALAHLVSVSDAPVLVLVTRRTAAGPRSDALVAALAALTRAGALRIRLDGLAAGDVTTLLGRHVGGAGPELGAVVAERTGGNPLFVIEFGRLLRAAGVTDPERAARVPAPDGVADVLRVRLGGLPEPARELLAVAAVAGRDIDPALIAAASGATAADVLDALDTADAAGLVRAADGRGTFAHALVRETLYGDLAAARRTRLHAALAGALESRLPGDPERRAEVAHHYRMAAPLGPGYAAKAVEHLAAAARTADERHAAQESVELWRQAVATTGLTSGPDPVRQLTLLSAQAAAEMRLGGTADARRHVAEAIAIGRLAGRWELAGQAAAVLTDGGGVWAWRPYGTADDGMTAALRDCLAHLPDGPLAALVLAALQLEYSFARRLDDAGECGHRSVAMARAAGDCDVLIRVLNLRALATWGPGAHAERRAIGTELLTLPLRGEQEVAALFQYGTALHEAGLVADADAAMARCRAAAARLRHTAADVPLAWWQFMRAVERDDPGRFALGTAALDLHRRSGIVTMDEMSGIHALRTAATGARVPDDVVASAEASGNPGFRALVGHALAEAGDPAAGVRLLGPAAPGQTPDYAALAADCLRTAVFAAAGQDDGTRASLDRITGWSGELVLYGNADHLGAVDYFIASGLAALGQAGAAARHARAAAGRCFAIGNRPWGRRAAALADRLAAGKPAGSPPGRPGGKPAGSRR